MKRFALLLLFVTALVFTPTAAFAKDKKHKHYSDRYYGHGDHYRYGGRAYYGRSYYARPVYYGYSGYSNCYAPSYYSRGCYAPRYYSNCGPTYSRGYCAPRGGFRIVVGF
jgi:hypothetical protein